jgi:hypothetical protein
MEKRLKASAAKALRIRARLREMAGRRAEFHAAYMSLVRELAELARRSVRRRRVGDL